MSPTTFVIGVRASQAQSCQGQPDDQCTAAASLSQTDCAHRHASAEQPGESHGFEADLLHLIPNQGPRMFAHL